MTVLIVTSWWNRSGAYALLSLRIAIKVLLRLENSSSVIGGIVYQVDKSGWRWAGSH